MVLVTPSAVGFGIVCRVLSILAVSNQSAMLAVEFSTPLSVAPDGIILCSRTDTPAVAIGASGTRVASVLEGGDQFAVGGAASAAVDLTTFLLGGSSNALGLDALEGGVLDDLLSRDPHYSASYDTRRLDDLPAAFVRRRTALAGEETADNCVLISARWKAATRYEVTLEVPRVPGVANLTADMAIWLAPVTYSASTGGGGVARISVRGDKRGSVCELAQRPLATTCPANSVLSPRNGGECVFCTGAIGGNVSFAASNCSCASSNRLRLVVGLQACSDALSFAAQTLPKLAEQLCVAFSEQKASILAGITSDALSPTFTSQLLEVGTAFVDEHLVEMSRETYEPVTDGRRWPANPTRKYGLARCAPAGTVAAAECNTATFIDSATNAIRSYTDMRLASLDALRLVGFTLVKSGLVSSCTALYDPTTTTLPVDPYPTRRTTWNWREL
jgi:hypothetical protein